MLVYQLDGLLVELGCQGKKASMEFYSDFFFLFSFSLWWWPFENAPHLRSFIVETHLRSFISSIQFNFVFNLPQIKKKLTNNIEKFLRPVWIEESSSQANKNVHVKSGTLILTLIAESQNYRDFYQIALSFSLTWKVFKTTFGTTF